MLLFTLEGFSPAALSCYGASWNRTEAIDSLAAGGTTWDRVITPVTDPITQLDRWLSSDRFPAEEMIVVTDDGRIGELPSSDRLGELIVIPPRELRVAQSLEETTLAALAAIAAEQLPDNPHVWLHSRFLTQVWDAPRELFPIDQFDEADLEPLDPAEASGDGLPVDDIHEDAHASVPAILDSWQPPHETIQADADPDWIMAWMRTYGCQIRLANAIVGLLREVAQASEHAAMIVAGTSGFSLGQNGAIGHRAGPLRSCHLHVPLVAAGLIDPTVGSPSSDVGAGIRDRRVRSADILPAVISNWTNGSNAALLAPDVWAARPEHTENAVVTSAEDQRAAITTDEWFFVRQTTPSDPTDSADPTASAAGHLFLKPDDLNDVNDVARLKPEVVEQFEEKLA